MNWKLIVPFFTMKCFGIEVERNRIIIIGRNSVKKNEIKPMC